jgi:hypothetical protein
MRQSFGTNTDKFYTTWINILKSTVTLPPDVDFIDMNPGIVIKDDRVNLQQLRHKITSHSYTKKLTVIATPVFFFDYDTGQRNHFTVLYITIDKSFGSRNIPKISINYFNPHGVESSRIPMESKFINNIRSILLEDFSRSNPSMVINIRTHLYNGINLQDNDPMGMCIFYGFIVLTYFMQYKISNTPVANLSYNITINQLVDELLDTFLYEGTDNCGQLLLVAEEIKRNLPGSRRISNESIALQAIKKYLNEASNVHIKKIAKAIKSDENKRSIIREIKNRTRKINKVYKLIFGHAPA